jgi:two-component system sensor histidine kinase YesM
MFYQMLSGKVTGPVKEIIKTMRKMEDGDLTARYVSRTTDEFDIIGRSLNSMIGVLQQKIDTEYVLVLKQRNSEYKALQSQIQPHFLFNTLSGFIALNQIGEKDLLEASIINLTVLLRYILNHPELTTLEEELRIIEKYCSLQQLRFGTRLNVRITCEGAAKALKVPKLLLQPLAENAIIHGIEPADNACLLTVAADTVIENNRSCIRIRIEDNGAGFDAGQTDWTRSIGLANTQERLKLCFPESQFSLESSIGAGTRILIHIPQEVRHENSHSG